MNLNIVKHKYTYIIISSTLLIASIVFLLLWGLKLGIDFTGGTTFTYTVNRGININQIQSYLTSQYSQSTIIKENVNTYQVEVPPLSQSQLSKLQRDIYQKFNLGKAQSITTIGPTIGSQLRNDAIYSIIIVMIGIILYIAWAFREVPKPANSLIFGSSAILAMIHDTVIVLGAFAILGHFLGAPVDTLFITAVLTVIGFSVHDTIVVFDRIRENLLKKEVSDFANTVNNSLMQTLNRSLNTSFTVLLVLVALFMLGGITIRWFAVALLIGIFSGTYSSIFVASQLLVIYYEYKDRNRK
jgi:preprotein translocase subunit SecF